VCFAFSNDRKRATLNDCLSQHNYELLEGSFADPTVSADQCVEIIDTIFGSDTFISMTQMEALLKILCEQKEAARHTELSKVRITFVARCFHKLVQTPQNVNLVDKLTSIEERKAVEKALGSVSACPFLVIVCIYPDIYILYRQVSNSPQTIQLATISSTCQILHSERFASGWSS
jgi:hypothetical protein